MTQRAKLCGRVVLASAVAGVIGCAAPDGREPAPTPIYDGHTRQLVRLDWDANGDGRIDQRTYTAGTTPLRSEIDGDGNGRVDRWEYVTPEGQVAYVGTSSGGDGVEDTWTWPINAAGETVVGRAQYRDAVIDRREFYLDDRLVRAEEDANRDGQPDKWELWERGRLRMTAFDTTFSGRRPDRRLIYDDAGRFARMEADPDGDGHFEALPPPGPGRPGKDIRD